MLVALHAAISLDSYLIVTRPIFDAYPVPAPLLAGTILLYLGFAPPRREAAAEELLETDQALVLSTT
jgi:hypothetical protein